jgi:hypothetical protein
LLDQLEFSKDRGREEIFHQPKDAELHLKQRDVFFAAFS